MFGPGNPHFPGLAGPFPECLCLGFSVLLRASVAVWSPLLPRLGVTGDSSCGPVVGVAGSVFLVLNGFGFSLSLL